MKFSICIPAYEMHGRGAEYLRELLQSVEKQTYKNFEVIISDQAIDGSIAKVCEEWKGRLPLTYLPFQKERGWASKNLNNAINHASGEVIKVIDLDDFLESAECLAKIKEALEKNPRVLWGTCGFIHTDSDRRHYYRPKTPFWSEKLIYGKNSMSCPSVLFFRTTVKERLDENLFWMNDCEFYYRLGKKYGLPLIIPETLVTIRVGVHQITHSRVNAEVRDREIRYSLKKHGGNLLPYELERLTLKAKQLWRRHRTVAMLTPLQYLRNEFSAAAGREDLLTKLANRYNSDKGTRKIYRRDGDRHFYTPIYDRYFKDIRKQPLRVLEIGIGTGASLKIWPRYFPRAKIYALDIDDFSKYDTSRLVCLAGDQADRNDLNEALQKITDPLDIIIDDGGHYMRQQQVSFGFLFPHLKPGGLYFIEDLCTSYWPYNGKIAVYNNIPIDTNADKSNTTLVMIKKYLSDKVIKSQYMSSSEEKYLTEHIDKAELYDTVINQYGPNHLAVFRKK